MWSVKWSSGNKVIKRKKPGTKIDNVVFMMSGAHIRLSCSRLEKIVNYSSKNKKNENNTKFIDYWTDAGIF